MCRRDYIRNDIISSDSAQATRAVVNTPVILKKQKKSKHRIKFATVGVYASVFALLVVMIGIGYRAPQETIVANSIPTPNETKDDHSSNALVGDVVATNIAADVALAANLSVAPSVNSLAQSTRIESETIGVSDTGITKPAIIEVSSASRNIATYIVVAGDDAMSVAAKFNISKDTLKWANNLTTDTLVVGSSLQILPRDGIVYTVKSGDTIDSITQKYKGDSTTITSYNDLELTGIKAGLKIIIPNGVLPTNERPGFINPVSTLYAGYSSGVGDGRTWRIRTGTPMYAGNNYAIGNCTAYVFDRRVELGKPVRASWGNAVSWAAAARSAGYTVNNSPSVGAVIQNGGGAGHVAIVENILDNGDLELSEMNFGGGWNVVSGRILPAANVGQYLYIH